MHPILSSKDRLALYLAGWLPVAGLVAILVRVTGGLTWRAAVALAAPLTALYAFLCLASWYLCRNFPLERNAVARLFLLHAVAAFLSASIWLLAGRGWALALGQSAGWPEVESGYTRAVPLLFATGLLLFLLTVAIHYLLAAFEVSREAELRALELRVLARESELRALRAQLDPHFLFNSLNSVAALATADPAGARRMTLLLAEFLRETLRVGASERIPFQEELRLAESYLAIERVRLGPRLCLEETVDPGVAGWPVPPLLLQPLVENAVSHGIVQLADGGVLRIAAQRNGSRLEVRVSNPCDPERPRSARSGLGLDNLRRRLTTLYGTEARLDVAEQVGEFAVTVSVPS